MRALIGQYVSMYYVPVNTRFDMAAMRKACNLLA